jgi:stage II sporulation protein D
MQRPSLFICGVLCLALFSGGETAAGTPWFSGGRAEPSEMALPATVKVALLHSRYPVAIGCSGDFSYTPSSKAKPVALGKKSLLKIKVSKQGMVIGTKTLTTLVKVVPADGETLTVNGRPYRGNLLVRPRGGRIDVIEQLGLEEYLYGVLPREVGADWPADALKAQAVISRTYVVANIRKSEGKGYDVSSDVFSQVYGGLRDEQPASNRAVDDTRGEILIDKAGTPVLTFFHSSCGGRTEGPQYVWQEIQDAPDYLDSVKDPYCKDDPFYHWDFSIGAESLQKRLRRAGYRGGIPTKVSISKESPSGRAWVFAVESPKGRSLIQGNKFRLAVGADVFRSTLITEIKKQGKTFRFEGRGWGHGVGLCQWGARGRALEGHSYGKILAAYYPNVRLVKTGEAANTP